MPSGSMAHPSAPARGGASSCSSSSLWFASSLHRSFSASSSFLFKPLTNRSRCEPYKQLRVQSNNSEIGIWDSSRNPKLSANHDNAATMKQLWVEETNKLNWLKLQHQLSKSTVEELPVNINQGRENINGSNGSLRTHVMDKDTEESNIHQGLKNINGSNGSLRTHVTDKETEESNIPQGLKNINGSNGSLRTHVTDKETEESNSHQGLKNINVSNGSLRTHVMDKETEKSKDAPVKQLNSSKTSQESFGKKPKDATERLRQVYNEVLVVDNIEEAKRVVRLLTTKYRNFIHGCDTEVAKIDVKQETPVNHGELICFSIYSHNSDMQADFGNGKPCIWVDVLDGERDVLKEFVPFFEDPLIKKVWHNYSFDSHIIENYGINLSGFHADTMHMARLWDSSRRIDGGYSLEALSGDSRVMSGTHSFPKSALNIGKISMKSIFGKKKIKKDGSEGKLVTMDSVETLQREERELWVSYSALDSISTLRLYESLKGKLEKMEWILEGSCKGTMYDFYREYWSPFGALLVKMETEGMLVDRAYLSEIEKVAIAEQKMAADKFRDWASSYCTDARHMNVGSDAQIRQLLFGGVQNNKNPDETLPRCRTFKIPNTEKVIENGKKAPLKNRNITLCSLVENMQTESFTASGWPSVSGSALKSLAGKIPIELIYTLDEEASEEDGEVEVGGVNDEDKDSERSMYGAAYDAFGRGKKGKEACHAIAALCEMCSIDSLISNFILPLQGDHISCQNGRIHCSLNINTETGRLSARAPNLQNQPALEKDRYKIRQAFIAAPGKSLIVADYGQLELRILAHLAGCQSMLDAFEAGGDFHSRTAMNMYDHIRKAVEEERVILEWHPQPGQEKPPVPLLKDAFGSERRKAKMLNFSIAYGKTPMGLARDWKVSLKEAKETVKLWYRERQEVLTWQQKQKRQAAEERRVCTLLGRARRFPSMYQISAAQRGHIERAAINAPVQGSAADVAMCAMLEIDRNVHLKELGWKLLLQVHDEVILEGPTESANLAKSIVVDCMSKPFYGTNFLKVDLSVDAKCAQNWYAAK